MLLSWREAASDLGFVFTAPFILRIGELSIACFGHVASFGSPGGVAVFTAYNPDHCRVASEQGYAYSCISESHEPYVRSSFVDMLNDWGWCSSEQQPPDWYVGTPWSGGAASGQG